jgi:hypothetical protein
MYYKKSAYFKKIKVLFGGKRTSVKEAINNI